jgi:hypothetical protein
MKLKLLTYSLLLVVITAGCKKEDIIEPEVIQPMYTLPQGNHPYDKTIVDFYNTYGTYILYKFTEKDFRWNINSNILFTGTPADENYVEPALAALDKYLFKVYPTGFLKKALPYKIMLASRIRSVLEVTPEIILNNYNNSASSASQLSFGNAGSTITTLTEAQLKVMKAELNREFWRQAIVFNKIEMPPVFVAATTYDLVTSGNRRTHGVFTLVNLTQNAYGDFIDYMYNITLQTPQEWEQTVFTATNDPAGKFRLKYNAIINYYKQKYGIDLQAISQVK